MPQDVEVAELAMRLVSASAEWSVSSLERTLAELGWRRETSVPARARWSHGAMRCALYPNADPPYLEVTVQAFWPQAATNLDDLYALSRERWAGLVDECASNLGAPNSAGAPLGHPELPGDFVDIDLWHNKGRWIGIGIRHEDKELPVRVVLVAFPVTKSVE